MTDATIAPPTLQAPRRGRGFVHHPERYHHFGAPHPTTAAAPFPLAAALSQFLVRILNQGRTESCGGHGTSQLVFVALAAAGLLAAFGPDYQPSPGLIYKDAQSEEQPGTGELLDNGIDPVDLITALAREGVKAMALAADGSIALTPDGRMSDLWSADDIAGIPNAPPPNVGLRPTALDDVASRAHLVVGVQLLNPAEADFEDQVCDSIANDKAPVGVGIHATAAFEAWGDSYADGKPPFADITGFSQTDGHWVGVFDYRTEADGSRSFWILNSWGKWGTPNGGIWVTGTWLRAACMVALQFRCALKAAA